METTIDGPAPVHKLSSRLSTVLVAMALVTLGVAPAAFAQDATGTVTILHGVPGLEVDVYANGDPLLEGFAPGDSSGATELPAGDYDVTVLPAGEDPAADPAIAATLTVAEGVDATAIAHLDAEGAPTISVFENDTSQIPAGEARLVVRHTAAFGAVDVLAGGDAIVEGLENPDEAALTVPADSYDVAVTAAGDPATEAFGGELALDEGTAYLVHAIGDPSDESFDLLVQTIDGLHTAPSGVDTGSGGLAADGATGIGVWPAVLTIALLTLGLGIGGPALARQRATQR